MYINVRKTVLFDINIRPLRFFDFITKPPYGQGEDVKESVKFRLCFLRTCDIIIIITYVIMEKIMFDAKKTTEELVIWVKDWFDRNGNGCKAVIGISGGKDSSVAAAVCARALGRDKVIGVLMPNGEQYDISASYELVEHLGIEYHVVNIKDAYDGIIGAIKDAVPNISDQSLINLAPRLRMSALYCVSQSNNGRVINTCNLSEDWIGYSTRYGDAAGDVSPLALLTVDEVKAIGRELGLPSSLVDKVPSDGLCGKTDEDNIGFTYASLDSYIRSGICEDPALREKIDRRHFANKFKLELMEHYDPELPVLAND